MAEFELPEAREIIDSFGKRMKEHLTDLDDLGKAIESADNVADIVDEWESRRLLRELGDGSKTH